MTTKSFLVLSVVVFTFAAIWLRSHLSDRKEGFDVRNVSRPAAAEGIPFIVSTVVQIERYKNSVVIEKKGDDYFIGDEVLVPDSWTPQITKALKSARAHYLVVNLPAEDRLVTLVTVRDRVQLLPVDAIVIQFKK